MVGAILINGEIAKKNKVKKSKDLGAFYCDKLLRLGLLISDYFRIFPNMGLFLILGM